MASNTPPPSPNHTFALVVQSNDGSRDTINLWADPTTHRLLVDASVSISGLATAVTDGEAVDVADTGNLILGTDGSNYQVVRTDSSGYLLPGTGTTNIGKAKDSSVSSGDVGVASFAKLRYDAAHSTGADGTYDTLDLTSWHELRTRDQRQIDLQNCNSSTDFTILGNDTANLANSVNHIYGTGAITFDKVNGAANTVFAGVSFTLSSINISSIFEDGAFVTVASYIPSLTNVSYVFLRLGTNSSNYNEWQWPVADLTAATWQLLRKSTGLPTTYAGNGWNSTDIDYGAVGVAFSNETNTLSGIVIDHISFVGGRLTDSTNNVAVTSSITTPNVNIQRFGGTAISQGQTTMASSMPVAIASNQTTLPAGGDVASGASDSGNPLKVGGRYNATPPTLTDGQRGDVQLNSRGSVRVIFTNGTSDMSFGNDNGDGVASSATSTKAQFISRNSVFNGSNWDRQYTVANGTNSTGTGITATGIIAQFDDTSPTAITENQFGNLRMSSNRNLYGTIRDAAGNERGANVTASNELNVIESNSAAIKTSTELIDDTIFTDDTSTHTPGTTKVQGIGMVADDASTDSVNEGDIGMPRMTLDRKVITTVQPTTANGLSVFNATSSDGATALTSTAQAVKASAGQVYGWYIYNPNSSAQFVQFYNVAAASVTVGTTNPLFMLTIPATAGANVEFTNGIEFTNAGFSIAATSTAGGNGAPSTALDAVIFYK